MYQKSVIFGASTLGRLLFFYLNQEGAPPEAFVVDDAYYKRKETHHRRAVQGEKGRRSVVPEYPGTGRT